ncbi:nitrous oxide reductase family maturation protein NosD [Solitalea lacus]|uniref:nitrous oxide reductase family maturation protein NosD n=1 Tax=Solitalea lacus TaxID=2911172 RepID=UPI001EDC05C6|nr:nitrous oxide reductase family maturation protein NosD [Solitalea lacus]UKJ08920.1 nitrous oxide reductase family maturation protein NosD [Solitalea lacus]
MIRHLILLLTLICCHHLAFAQKKLFVGPNEQFKRIESALATAQNGDEIVVKKSIYPAKNIIISKSIKLTGQNYPVLDGQGKDEILTILANNVTVNGFEIKNTNSGSAKDYAGIRVFKASNIKLVNNRLRNTFFGIYLSDALNVTVKNNDLNGTGHPTRSGNGIHLWQCKYIHIENNKISRHRDGIYFEFAKHSLIKNNRSEQNIRYGLHFMFSDDDAYIGNTFTNNGSGVAVMYTKRIKMLNNVFENNRGSSSYGLLLKDISDSRIENNRFINNTIGIYLEGSSRIKILSNDFSQNGWAVRLLANCENDHFENNNFIANTFDLATNGTHFQNSFKKNYWDKYDGYDMDKNKAGDVPYRPVSLYSQIMEKMPYSVMLMRSFIVNLLDKAEKAIPSITPETIKDEQPLMQSITR